MAVSVAVLSSSFSSRPAYAFGALVSSGSPPVREAAEQILFVDNPDSTVTAVVRMKVVGPSQSLAWLIPVRGKPTLAPSSSTVFRRLEAVTRPAYLVEVTTAGTCTPPDPGASSTEGADARAPGDDAGSGPDEDLTRGRAGRFDYAYLEADSKHGDLARAATDWLEAGGFAPRSLDSRVLAAYAKDGFGLLALRLNHQGGSRFIRPIALTYESKQPTIPIRLARASAADALPIRVWVIGASQAVPRNYESLVLNEARLDWSTGNFYRAGTLPAGGAGLSAPDVRTPANYDALVSDAVEEAGGQGFVTELAEPASRFRQLVWSAVDARQLDALSKGYSRKGIEAIVAAKEHFGDWDGFAEALERATSLPAGVSLEQFARAPDRYRAGTKVDARTFLRLLRERVVRPVSDAGTMLYRAPYLTRLYTRVRPDDVTVDPTFDYNADLAQIGKTHIGRQVVTCGPGTRRRDAHFRLALPHGGTIAGKVGAPWPVAGRSMPANLEIVALSTSGPGKVLKDNAKEIGVALFRAAGERRDDIEMPHPPRNGAPIGGPATVTPQAAPASTHGGNIGRPTTCSLSDAGGGASDASALSLPLAGLLLSLRRRGALRARRRTGRARREQLSGVDSERN